MAVDLPHAAPRLAREGLQLLENILARHVCQDAAGSRGLVYVVQGLHGRVGHFPAYALLEVGSSSSSAEGDFDPFAPRPPLAKGARVELVREGSPRKCDHLCQRVHSGPGEECTMCGRG